MTLAWLRSHARNRNRGTTRNRSNSRLAAQRAHEQFAGAEAYAPRVTYDNSFIVDSSVTSRDATWTSDEQYKRHYFLLGWEIAPIRKDGNCLFRALSDQLYGHERRHLELRRRLIDFIDLERHFFEPFVAGEGVVEYCSRLREAGAWAGHAELIAASRLLGVTIVVHTGPVKRLRIDTDTDAKNNKEGQGKLINLLRKHDHYSSLRKREKPLEEQHGCTNMCLCKRIVTPSRASFDFGSSQADLGLSFLDHRNSDAGTRNSLEPTDFRPEICGGSAREETDVNQRQPVPDAVNLCVVDSSRRKKSPKSQRSAPAEHPKISSSSDTTLTISTLASPVQPSQHKSPVAAVSGPPKAFVSSNRSPSHQKLSSPCSTPAGEAKGVVLFQPESLKPVVKPKVPLVMLFNPDEAPKARPTWSKTGRVNTSTPMKPTSAMVVEVDVEEPEMNPDDDTMLPLRGIHRPRRAVFNGGKRRRSSAATLSLKQEVSTSLNTSKPEVASIKPVTMVVTTVKSSVETTDEPVVTASSNGPAPRSVEIKKSSKKVFRQGRPVAAP